MDKRVIFAVAGSGKTTYIIKQLTIDKKTLVITYTNNNIRNLREGIVKKFGYFPLNIRLLSYFSFLYSFCFKPFLLDRLNVKGISYKKNPNRYSRSNKRDYFIDANNRLYSNRISKLLDFTSILDEVYSRITKYFDSLYIDEIQDFASHDFNFILNLSRLNIDMLLVGDFFQHTFDTSRDGTTNKNLYNNYEKYKQNFLDAGINPDEECLHKSFRCSPSICDFITNKIGINILSKRIDKTKIHFISNSDEAERIFFNNECVKLFYQDSNRYNCFSKNWGDSKGTNIFNDVCVALNKTTLSKFKEDILRDLPQQTKNKLYVACSRTRNDLYFIPEELFRRFKN